MDRIGSKNDLYELLDLHRSSPPSWEEPIKYNLEDEGDREDVTKLIVHNDARVIDNSEEVLENVFPYDYPEYIDTAQFDSKLSEYKRDVLKDERLGGDWFYRKWDNTILRYPGKYYFGRALTLSSGKIITAKEFEQLQSKRAIISGLSTGSLQARNLVQGSYVGNIALLDFDTIEPKNLNRIEANYSNVTQQKIDAAAISISELNPYVSQIHYREGFNNETMEKIRAYESHICFDQIDDLAIKALMRSFCQSEGIPLIMATDSGDNALVDVERYDQSGTKPFNGRISKRQIEKLLNKEDLSDNDLKMSLIRIVGLKNIGTRVIDSTLAEDGGVGTFPQIHTTASMGAAAATIAAREILLGRKMDSGRYEIKPKKVLGLQSPDNLSTQFNIYKRLLDSML